MAKNDGFDVAAFEAHLNVIYHNRLTDIVPPGLNLYGGKRNGESDGLQQKLAQAAGLVPHETAKPVGTAPGAAPTAKHGDIINAGAETQAGAQASARDKLAQEAVAHVGQIATPAKAQHTDQSGIGKAGHIVFSNAFAQTVASAGH